MTPHLLSTSSPSTASEVKSCCAAFYENDLVRALLGDSFHPGGLRLTQRLGEALRLTEEDVVLDIACGTGASACGLVKKFGCRVVGVDLSAANLERARHRAEHEGVAARTEFRLSDAERLAANDGEFSAVVSECSFCLFPGKPRAAREMFRVLRAGGRVGITDMAVDRARLPEELLGLMAHVACLADARTVEEYRGILGAAGFRDFFCEDHADALREMLARIAKQILLAEIAVGLGKLNLNGFDLKAALRVVKQCEQLIADGVMTYTLLTAQK